MNFDTRRAAKAAPSAGTSNLSLQKRGGSFPKPDKNSILVCPIGGVGQIGMNFTLYGYDGRWVLVDAGSAFAPRDIDGVEAIFPDPASLRPIIPFLDALIVTHAHEDHIGAIHRLWPGMKCPIIATPYAAAIISGRLREAGTLGEVKIKTFLPNQTFNVGKFSVRSVRMTHSAPECVALSFRTPIGSVLHTGDWKFDPHPVVGKPTNMRGLREIGDAGVLAMVCDSTNADRMGETTSERDVGVGMRRVFKQSSGMVVVACFSSNVARLASVARAAAETGREVALAGRSLINAEKAARECGLLAGVPTFLADPRHLKGLNRRQMVLLCTGAQGEGNAALSKLAAGDSWRLPKLHRGDTVVHSARVIPGNEQDVHELFDKLREQGVRVLQGDFKGSPLHVTGHAVANEIAEMYGMIRPRFAIPVHGERKHLDAHAAIAYKAGVQDLGVAGEGDVFSVNASGISKVASVKIDLVAELSGSERGRYVPWDAKNPYAFLDHIESQPKLLVA